MNGGIAQTVYTTKPRFCKKKQKLTNVYKTFGTIMIHSQISLSSIEMAKGRKKDRMLLYFTCLTNLKFGRPCLILVYNLQVNVSFLGLLKMSQLFSSGLLQTFLFLF